MVFYRPSDDATNTSLDDVISPHFRTPQHDALPATYCDFTPNLSSHLDHAIPDRTWSRVYHNENRVVINLAYSPTIICVNEGESNPYLRI